MSTNLADLVASGVSDARAAMAQAAAELTRQRERIDRLEAALRAISSYVVTEHPERPELKAAAQQRVDYLQSIARAALTGENLS